MQAMRSPDTRHGPKVRFAIKAYPGGRLWQVPSLQQSHELAEALHHRNVAFPKENPCCATRSRIGWKMPITV